MITGQMNISGNIAYVSQQPWIQNLSLKDNIVFNQIYDNTKYQEIINACSLKDDLNLINYAEIWHFTCNGLVLQVQGADALTHDDQNDDEMKHLKDRQGWWVELMKLHI